MLGLNPHREILDWNLHSGDLTTQPHKKWILIGYSGITFIIFSRQSVFRGRFSDQPITMFYGFFLTNQNANLSDILETASNVSFCWTKQLKFHIILPSSFSMWSDFDPYQNISIETSSCTYFLTNFWTFRWRTNQVEKNILDLQCDEYRRIKGTPPLLLVHSNSQHSS